MEKEAVTAQANPTMTSETVVVAKQTATDSASVANWYEQEAGDTLTAAEPQPPDSVSIAAMNEDTDPGNTVDTFHSESMASDQPTTDPALSGYKGHADDMASSSGANLSS